MTDKLKDWSTTAASNNSAAPDGWPEGMAPSDVNNSARQGMASVAEWYQDAEWINRGDTATAYTSTTLTITGDVTGYYTAGRKIRLDSDNSKVAKIESAVYTSSTEVTVSGYTIAALPSTVEVHIVSDEDYLPIIPPSVPDGYIYGCGLSNNSSDSNHDIDVAAGKVKDSTNAYTMEVSALTKRIDANWAAGTGNGGFPSGLTLSPDTWYRVFVIGKTDGTTDIGFDTDASATNLLSDATGYTLFRRIGWVLTNGSSNINSFEQYGDQFFWQTVKQTSITVATSATAHTADAPPSTLAEMVFNISFGGASDRYFIIKGSDWNNETPSASKHTLAITGQDANTRLLIPVDTSSQFDIRADDTSSTSGAFSTMGWRDTRGQ
ncbi:MAG: hypothetical protein R3311_12200 [Oceanisphaera sp.]|nr:hypothetical protein [Oceanisphaera sp.]